jgi:hypothetical protein
MKNHIVCIASEHKGNEFLDEAQNAGWHVSLVTRKKLLDQPWLWTALNDVKTVEDDAPQENYVRAITNIAGSRKIDRVVGLDEFDVLTAARAREHLQLGGMSSSHALRFRDKLSMRSIASRPGYFARNLPAYSTGRRSAIILKTCQLRGSSSHGTKFQPLVLENASRKIRFGRC